MATGDPIFVDFTAATPPVPQAGAVFTDRTYGADDGHRKFLVHPRASRSAWPQKGDADKENPSMFVVDVGNRKDPSTLVELDVTYRGISGTKTRRVTPDCDTQMLTLPVYAGGVSANMLVPMPQPTCTSEFVATAQPNLDGVGNSVAGDYLPDPPSWSIRFTPDPGKPPTLNAKTGWVLQSRGWEEIIPRKVWLVHERAVYYFAIAST